MTKKDKPEELDKIHQEAKDYMTQNIVYWLDEHGDIMEGQMMKEAYEKFFPQGVFLDDLKKYMFEIKEIYEGRGREYRASH